MVNFAALNKKILSSNFLFMTEIVFNCNVSVYTNISGLFTVRPTDYQINSYNPTFSRLIFGYDDKELLNKVK
jgi:hypothetical protein